MTKQNLSDSREGSGNPRSRVEEVNEIMLAEFERSHSAATHFEDPDAETNEIIELIAEAILERMKLERKFGAFDEDIYPLRELVHIIDKAQLDPDAANRAFDRIRTGFAVDSAGIRIERGYRFNTNETQDLFDVAVSYLQEKLKVEYKGLEVTEIIGQIERRLDAMDSRDGYLFHAMIGLKQDAEKELELLTQDIERKSRLSAIRQTPKSSENVESTGKGKVGDREKRQKDAGLTGDVAATFFYYLFKGLDVKVANTQQAELIEMLTGYSSGQTVKFYSKIEKTLLEIEVKSEINEKFLKDMETVRKRFQKLGLTAICDLIDRDLGEKT